MQGSSCDKFKRLWQRTALLGQSFPNDYWLYLSVVNFPDISSLTQTSQLRWNEIFAA